MKYFDIKGMSCAACSARVEQAVSRLEGVKACSVSLLTNSMAVDSSLPDEQIIAAVTNAGYSASLKGAKTEPAENSEVKKLLSRFVISAVLMLVLMYIAMGHMVGLPAIPYLSGNPIVSAVIQMALSLAVMVINRAFFINGVKGMLHRSPNMDSLVCIGSAAAFVYSVCMLFIGDVEALHHGLYFESAAMILTLITLGKTLEAHSKGKTTSALKGLINLAPKTANIIIDGKEQTVDISMLKLGDIFVVRPGESIAADGVIIEGDTSVDESTLTGESIPVDKTVGDTVSAGAVNRMGFIKCKATSVGEETTLSKIIKLMSDSAATKAPIAKVADKVSGVFVPTVILIALITIAVWLIIGQTVGFALLKGISVLVISCPCALGLATPVAIMVANGRAAKSGILFKTAEALENIGKADIIVLDKTGTVTTGKPTVTDIVATGCTNKELLTFAASIEEKSEHPLAKAIVEKAKEEGNVTLPTTSFEVVSGSGVSAVINNEKYIGGNLRFISKYVEIEDSFKEKAAALSNQGKTTVFFAKESGLLGIIALSDTIKEDSQKAIKELKRIGLKTLLLTGDNRQTALAVAKETGIDEAVFEVLPQDKANEISRLKKCGRVVMVGDGINDAPALASADVGVAIGTGTDIAVAAADVVVMRGSLTELVKAVKIGRAALRNIKQNLFWAFAYNVIGIPIAAGALAGIGIELSPMLAAAAMSLSSFCVVSNALRLQRIKLNTKEKKAKSMNITIKTEGMMCPHCEAHVKKALEEIAGVKEAVADHKTGLVTVTVEGEVDKDILTAAITAQGYKVIE